VGYFSKFFRNVAEKIAHDSETPMIVKVQKKNGLEITWATNTKRADLSRTSAIADSFQGLPDAHAKNLSPNTQILGID
jgi:hypothetical protein